MENLMLKYIGIIGAFMFAFMVPSLNATPPTNAQVQKAEVDAKKAVKAAANPKLKGKAKVDAQKKASVLQNKASKMRNALNASKKKTLNKPTPNQSKPKNKQGVYGKKPNPKAHRKPVAVQSEENADTNPPVENDSEGSGDNQETASNVSTEATPVEEHNTEENKPVVNKETSSDAPSSEEIRAALKGMTPDVRLAMAAKIVMHESKRIAKQRSGG